MKADCISACEPKLAITFRVLSSAKLRDFELINVEAKLVLSKEWYLHRCGMHIASYHGRGRDEQHSILGSFGNCARVSWDSLCLSAIDPPQGRFLGCSDELTYGLARGYFVAEQEKRPPWS